VSLVQAGQARVLVDGAVVVDGTVDPPPPGDAFFGGGSEEVSGEVRLEAGRPVEVVVEYVTRGAQSDFRGVKVGLRPPEPPDLLERAVAAAAGADAVVVVVGTNDDWETEGADRTTMDLPGRQDELVERVLAANPRTVVVVNSGAPVTMDWAPRAPAVLQAWFGGQEMARALADVLLGDADAAGRLPFSVPAAEEHLPFFDRDATAITYDRWFGQRLLDRDGHRAAFPLGHGLSYTGFALADLTLGPDDGDGFTASVTVTNTGTRDGRHVVQVYGRPAGAGDDFPSRVLLGFAPVAVPAGGSARVTVRGSVRPLMRWVDGGFVPAAATAEIEASGYAGDPAAVTATLRLT
jgi:hypothetical protein